MMLMERASRQSIHQRLKCTMHQRRYCCRNVLKHLPCISQSLVCCQYQPYLAKCMIEKAWLIPQLTVWQGTPSSKKKKMARLKRVMATVKKQERREKADSSQGFAAIQLLHDPQVRAVLIPPLMGRSSTLRIVLHIGNSTSEERSGWDDDFMYSYLEHSVL